MDPALFYCIVLIFSKALGSYSQTNSQTIGIKNVEVSWLNKGTQTEFFVTSSLNNIPDPISSSYAWIGVGINNNPAMSGTNAVVCKILGNSLSVQHYFNFGYISSLLETSQSQIGLTNVKVYQSQGNLTCSFTRDNEIKMPSGRYIKISPNNGLYIVVAYGPGDIGWHRANRGVSPKQVNFPLLNNTVQMPMPAQVLINQPLLLPVSLNNTELFDMNSFTQITSFLNQFKMTIQNFFSWMKNILNM